jgi:dTDP-4-dehydrorhamnose 3,5-epimerase
MMSFVFSPCKIEGLCEIQPKAFGDERGYFLEHYCQRDFVTNGLMANDLATKFVQDNESFSKKGVLRGLHFQKTHPQGKLIRVVKGEVFDVAVDIRPNSPTRLQWHSVILSGEKHNMFYIPEGFAHGFLVLSREAVFSYKCTDYYYPQDEGGIRYDAPDVGIQWPQIDVAYIISEKDKKLPGCGDL